MPDAVIPPRFLFRFAVDCLYRKSAWSGKVGGLSEEHRLVSLSELDGRKAYGDFRIAWSEEGLSIGIRVQGKRQPPWCRESRYEDSDGLHVWIDTRDTHNIHRASRFCHRFVFLPSGAGRKLADPVADQLLINRAREHAKPVRPGVLKAVSERRIDGYHLDALIPSAAMTGFEPADHPRLGFMYAIFDRELGEQTFCTGREFPYDEDPSVWGSLELLPAAAAPETRKRREAGGRRQ